MSEKEAAKTGEPLKAAAAPPQRKSVAEDAAIAAGKDTYRRLLSYVKPHKRQFAIAVLGMVGYALTDTAFAALMKPMLDGSFVEQDRNSILLVPLLIIGIFVLRGVAGFASTY